MSQPPNQPPGDDKPQPAKFRRKDVVGFTFHDTVTGRDRDGIGVVLGVADDGGPVTIRPLADYDLFVDPKDVVSVTASDVPADTRPVPTEG